MPIDIDEFASFRVDILSRLDQISRAIFHLDGETLKIKATVGRIDSRVSTETRSLTDLDELKRQYTELGTRISRLEAQMKSEAPSEPMSL